MSSTESNTNSGFSSLFKNRAFRILFTIGFVIFLLLAALSIHFYLDNNEFQFKISNSEIQLQSNTKEKQELLEIIKADEIVLYQGNYEEALTQYQNLLEVADEKHKEIIEQRIFQINQIQKEFENNEQDNINKNYVISQQRKQLNILKEEIDSLKNNTTNTSKELKKEIDILKANIDKKEKQLNRKERIQVLTFNSVKGVKVHYLGEVEDEKANGGGVGIWINGSIYRGDWKDNVRNGKGTFEWADGMKYDGEFKDGKRHGKGTYYWPSGERYEGDWENDMRNGKGTLFDKNSNIRYEGKWINDKPEKN